jgi:hypothetical protein
MILMCMFMIEVRMGEGVKDEERGGSWDKFM